MSTRGIYGLSGSGIDVDSMVKVGMLSKQKQYDKMYKTQTKNEWLKEAYANVYSEVSTFTNSTLSNYKMSSKLNPMTVSSKDSAVATAVANADAATMTHTVEVSSSASNAYLMSKEKLTRNTGASANSIYLSDLIDVSGWSAGDSLTIEVADSIERDGSDQIVSRNRAKLTLTYEDIVTNKQTLNDLASKMKALSSEDTKEALNIQAGYDATNDAFSIYNKNGGKGNVIELKGLDSKAQDLLKSLKLSSVETQADGTRKMVDTEMSADGVIIAEGKNGKVSIDGKEYETTSNKISVSNVSYTLGTVGKTTVSVSQDTDAAVETVKKFVEDYNKMIDSLNDKYNEAKYDDFGVLSKTDEAKMTADQVEKWNEKAKSGLLARNQTLKKIISGMREALYTPVEGIDGKYNTAMSLGISSSTDRGHIKLDETKLKKALAADPTAVYKVFAADGAVEGSTRDDYKKSGIANRIFMTNNDGLKEMKSYAGTTKEKSDSSTLGKIMVEMQKKMSDFKVMMSSYESLLYKKYDAMETAISRLSAQSGYILGGNS